MFEKYVQSIRALPARPDSAPPRPEFKLWEDASKKLACYYAPFEYINRRAELILVGITPGGTQMNNALDAARLALASGLPVQEAVAEVKRHGSFSGSMRPKLVKLLDKLGYNKRLGIASCETLWNKDFGKVHFCSLLKYPVFLGDKPYNGSPAPGTHPQMRDMLMGHFVKDLQTLPKQALLLPLGETVRETLVALKRRGLVPQKMPCLGDVVVAPPHPSPANMESINLALEASFPEEAEYCERMYRKYLAAPSRSGKPQPEARYKAIRSARWRTMRTLLVSHGLHA